MLHVQVDHIVLVQVLPKCLFLPYCQSPEQILRIAAAAVIGSKHLQCHRFPKTPRSADADILLFCIQTCVRMFDQSGLIHIDLGIDRFLKSSVFGIQIDPHKNTSLFTPLRLLIAGAVSHCLHYIKTKAI